jgi:hypothetical protein
MLPRWLIILFLFGALSVALFTCPNCASENSGHTCDNCGEHDPIARLPDPAPEAAISYDPILNHMTFTGQRQLVVSTSSGDEFRCFAPPEPFGIRGRFRDIHHSVFDFNTYEFHEHALQSLVEIITQDPIWRAECPQFALSAVSRKPTVQQIQSYRTASGYNKMFNVMSYEFTCAARTHGCPSALTVGVTVPGSRVLHFLSQTQRSSLCPATLALNHIIAGPTGSFPRCSLHSSGGDGIRPSHCFANPELGCNRVHLREPLAQGAWGDQ